MRELFAQGGVVMAAIAAASCVAWFVIAWKWFDLREERPLEPEWAERALALARCGRRESALEACPERGLLARVIRSALTTEAADRAHFERHMRPLIEIEAVTFARSLRLVQALGASAPLLGLLGTVVGMVHTFDAISGRTPDAGAVAGGISQALVTTQAGLVAGLSIVLVHGWLEARVRTLIETAELYARRTMYALLHD